MAVGDTGYKFIRHVESLLQGTALGRLGAFGYRAVRSCRLAFRRRALIREFGRNSLPLISFDDLVGMEPFTLSHYTFAPWSASPIEHALVQGLARRLQPCHFLEIGSLRAELLANLNGLVESSISLSLSKDDMRRRGYPPIVVETNLMYEPDVRNLQVIYEDSRNFDFSKLTGPQRNLVLIDGDHAYEAVRHDTRNVVRTCSPESVIVWHDYTLGDQATVHWPVFAGVLDGLPRTHWDRLYHVNHTVCAVLLPKAWSVRTHETPFRPERLFSVALKAREVPGNLKSVGAEAVGRT